MNLDNNQKEKTENNFVKILKGSTISIIISLIILLGLSIVLTFTSISEGIIPVTIMIVSAISILIGSTMSTMHINKNGMFNGGMVGLIYIMTIYLVSSMITSNFGMNVKTMILICISIIAGIVGGVIGVNLHKD